MVILAQVVIYGLGDMIATQIVTDFLRLLIDDVRGLGGVVSPDVEVVTDVILLEDAEHLGALLIGGLFAGGTECGGWGIGHLLKRLEAFLAQINEVLLQDTFHAVQGPIDPANVLHLFGLKHGAHEALVYYHGWSTALSD